MAKSPVAGLFATPNRHRLIDEYFESRTVTAGNAWEHAYRLLLWVDVQTGIAHCYESDKSQPGRAWYPRSLVFHDWVSQQLGVEPLELKDHVDFMFQQVLDRLLAVEATAPAQFAAQAQALLFDDPSRFPVFGDDPKLEAILARVVPPDVIADSDRTIATVREIYAHMRAENKRKNLLGRGFEDVLAALITRLPGADQLIVGTQTLIEDIPGFRRPAATKKREKVDLFVVTPDRRRILVTAKWSVRADREKQLAGDHKTYVDCNEGGPFEYLFITNEFDAARLEANALAEAGHNYLLNSVVHMNVEALKVVHELEVPGAREQAARMRIPDYVASRRIIGLDDWLRSLV